MAKSKTNKDKSKAKSNYTKNSKKLSKPDLISPLEKITDELKAEKEKFLRLFAEFENYKKRTSKERIELFKSANRELMSALIPVIDDFERAKNQTNGIDESEDIKGLYLIKPKIV